MFQIYWFFSPIPEGNDPIWWSNIFQLGLTFLTPKMLVMRFPNCFGKKRWERFFWPKKFKVSGRQLVHHGWSRASSRRAVSYSGDSLGIIVLARQRETGLVAGRGLYPVTWQRTKTWNWMKLEHLWGKKFVIDVFSEEVVHWYDNMGVSKTRGTPKWMVYNGNPY